VGEEELTVKRGDFVVVQGQIHCYQNRRELNVTHISNNLSISENVVIKVFSLHF
jgi:hypothetical protein